MADKADSGDSLTIQIPKVNGGAILGLSNRIFYTAFLLIAICNIPCAYCASASSSNSGPNESTVPLSGTAMRVITLFHSPDFQWPGGSIADGEGLVSPHADGTRYIEMSQSRDPAARVAWLQGAFRSDDHKHTAIAVSALSDTDVQVREAAAAALTACAPQPLDEAIWRWVSTTPAQVRVRADDVFPQLRENLGGLLLDRLEDDSTPVDRMAGAAYVLGRLGLVEAAPILQKRAWTRDPDLAYASADALARIARDSDLPSLRQLATHPEPGIRRIVVQGAANIGGKKGLELLHSMALHPGEPDPDVRVAAIAAIGTVRSPDSVHALIDILHKRGDFRNDTIDALEALTRLPLDPVVGTWTGWYSAWRQNPVWPIPLPNGSPFDPEFVQGNFAPQ